MGQDRPVPEAVQVCAVATANRCALSGAVAAAEGDTAGSHMA